MADEARKPSVQTDGNSNPMLTIQPGIEESGSTVSFGSDGSKDFSDVNGDLSIDPTQDNSSEVDEDAGLGETSQTAPEGGEPDPADDTQDSAEALPEFDHTNEEVLAAYDAKYTTVDDAGDPVINLDAFNEELNANFAEGKLDINPGSRAYLKKTFGISDSLINDHLEGLKAKADKADEEVYSKVGGKEAYDAALAWATAEGGYTADQKAKYNAAVEKAKKGDRTDLDEQLELLSSRAQRAGTLQAPARKIGIRRPSSPPNPAGSNSNPAPRRQAEAAPTDVFKNSEEHRLAQNEAYKSGDAAKIKAVSTKLTRSMQHKDWNR